MPPTHARRLERSPAVPRHPRRVSGPAHPAHRARSARAAAAAGALHPRAVPAGAAAGRAATAPGRARGSTAAFERIRALPDHRVVDRLLRGRACIWLIGMLLGGIVAMQVSLLKLNSSISESIEQSSTYERVNSDLEMQVAQLASGERIQTAAAKEGMVAP